MPIMTVSVIRSRVVRSKELNPAIHQELHATLGQALFGPRVQVADDEVWYEGQTLG